MAQRAGEPQLSVALEAISTTVPPTLTLTPTMPLSVLVSLPLVHGAPLYSVVHWQTFALLGPITEFVSMTATRVPEILLTASPSQAFVIFDTLFVAATSVIGSLPSG